MDRLDLSPRPQAKSIRAIRFLARRATDAPISFHRGGKGREKLDRHRHPQR